VRASATADGDDLHPLELLLAGGMAGLGAWVTSYPMDFIKTQLQAEPEGSSKYHKNRFLLDGGTTRTRSTTRHAHDTTRRAA
jgi:hypothetical protein